MVGEEVFSTWAGFSPFSPGGAAGKAPGKLGEWLQKPFSTSRKAANQSAAKGRQGRGKLPV